MDKSLDRVFWALRTWFHNYQRRYSQHSLVTMLMNTFLAITTAENAQCIDIAVDYSYEYLAGYVGDGVTCFDVNECEASVSACDKWSVCHYTLGSIYCTCKPGFEMNENGNCFDLDECVHF